VIANKNAGYGVREFEGFFASEVPHQKLILTIRRSCGSGFEHSD
jgi:hypothetical protein